jgi:hypothetical protein
MVLHGQLPNFFSDVGTCSVVFCKARTVGGTVEKMLPGGAPEWGGRLESDGPDAFGRTAEQIDRGWFLASGAWRDR